MLRIEDSHQVLTPHIEQIARASVGITPSLHCGSRTFKSYATVLDFGIFYDLSCAVLFRVRTAVLTAIRRSRVQPSAILLDPTPAAAKI
eukprot:5964207-Amphidinium_carterae.1